MAKRIGTVSGVALRPGVSRNGRLYTKELIADAVQRAQERLEEGDAIDVVDRRPLDQRTHHAAEDDSTRIVGRVRSLTLEPDGSARFEADLADTSNARTIASLVAPKDPRGGPDEVDPFLKGVSIRGAWVGRVRRENYDGRAVETADGLELHGLDYTGNPGVPGAEIDAYTPAGTSTPAETASDGRVLITESVQEALVTATIEEADGGPSVDRPGGPFADPGYQPDKKKRYDLSTKARAKAAWSYVNQADNARLYTSAQLKRIKQRITKALKGFGVTVAAQEGWLIEPAAQVTEALAECWDMDAKDAGNLYVSLTNGPTTVTVSSYSLDPHDLDAVGRAAMAGALQAILNIDPDLDADVDVPGSTDDDEPATAAGAVCPCGCGCAIPETPGSCPCACSEGQCVHCMGEDDDAMETAVESPAAPVAESDTTAPADATEAVDGTPQTSAPETPAAENPTPEGGPAMAEPTTAAETAAAPAVGGVTLTDDQFTQLLARLAPVPAVPAAAAESAPAEPVAEAQPATPAAEVAESDEERIARLVAEGVKAALPGAIQEHVEATGGPSRKGLVAPVTEHTAPVGIPGLPEGAPAKPLHEYTDEEWRQHMAPITVGAILKNRTTPGE
ncbi:DUF6582 domain-containing protein [Streptomyces sp. NPDC001617]